MKQVASLQYGVIFKKAFCDPEIFTAFVHDVLDIEIEVDHVETEKTFDPPIGRVASRFDLYAEDEKNRIIVDIQHVRYADHYDRFLHYHCAALLEQALNAENYRPDLKVYTIVVLTSGDKHKVDVATIDFDPKDLKGRPLGELPHKIVYICPKYVDENTPARYREWLLAIDDTLDEEVEETAYKHPQVQKVFTHIGKDAITPQERARMFAQHNEAELRQTMKEEGHREGEEKGRREGEEKGRQEGEEKGRQEGRQEGEEKGRQESTEMAARNMLVLGVLTIEQIAQVLNLTTDQVLSFKNDS
jgi:predicted transposase/invertase (TIGR01784 family)